MQSRESNYDGGTQVDTSLGPEMLSEVQSGLHTGSDLKLA